MRQTYYHVWLEFMGTRYSGWLVQPGLLTVQGAVEEALSQLFQQEIHVMGCSRTDAGVHAMDYHLHFYLERPLSMPLIKFPLAMNALLPNDIVVHGIEEAPDGFHAIKSARAKTYRYTIINRPRPSAFEHDVSWHVSYVLDFDKMHKASRYLVGEHNFKSFCSEPERKKQHIRHVHDILITREGEHVFIDVTANGFLYNMVRIIVGTLVDVGRGQMDAANVPAILEAKDRRKAGPTAPPQGLCLRHVAYAI